jgi:hypothetical protein
MNEISANSRAVSENKIKIDYAGNKGWLIFWAVVFFPVAFVLLATSAKFNMDGSTYYIKYEGSQYWLCFWVIFGFPIALALMLLNGVSLVRDRISAAL